MTPFLAGRQTSIAAVGRTTPAGTRACGLDNGVVSLGGGLRVKYLSPTRGGVVDENRDGGAKMYKWFLNLLYIIRYNSF